MNPLPRTGWLAVVFLAVLATGVGLRLRWPSSRPALDCSPEEVSWSDAGIARCDPLAPRQVPAGPGLTVGVKLDLNQASEEELALVPGVGAKLAREIVVARKASGRFRSWEEVDEIAGVGPAKLEALRAAAELR